MQVISFKVSKPFNLHTTNKCIYICNNRQKEESVYLFANYWTESWFLHVLWLAKLILVGYRPQGACVITYEQWSTLKIIIQHLGTLA